MLVAEGSRRSERAESGFGETKVAMSELLSCGISARQSWFAPAPRSPHGVASRVRCVDRNRSETHSLEQLIAELGQYLKSNDSIECATVNPKRERTRH